MVAKLSGHVNIRNGHFVLSTIRKMPVKNVTFQARYMYLFLLLLTTRKRYLIQLVKSLCQKYTATLAVIQLLLNLFIVV